MPCGVVAACTSDGQEFGLAERPTIPVTSRTTIRPLAQHARQSLAEAGAFVRSRAIPLAVNGQPGRKWDLFVDQPIDSIETCAVSCAAVSLVAVGDLPDSPLLAEAVRSLRLLQLPSGGWTSWITHPDDLAIEDAEAALVVDTFFALSALRALGLADSEAFARGVEWFRTAHDGAAGAWAFYPSGEPHVLPTCMAIVALSSGGPPSDPAIRDLVHRGVEWLINSQRINEAYGWSGRDNRPTSSVHTAWALRALTAAGFDRYSQAVVNAREWLLDNIGERDSIIDHYITPGRTSAGRPRPSRAITHISFPEGIIVHGLLHAGANLLDPRLLAAVDDLVARQDPEGYWRCLHAPREQPIYAIMDACLALRLFVDTVQRHEAVLEVSERIQLHEAVVDSINGQLGTLMQAAADTTKAVVDIGERLDEINRRLAAQERSLHEVRDSTSTLNQKVHKLGLGLAALRPVMWLTRLVVRWPVLAVLVVLQLLAYSLSAFTVPAEYRAYSLATGVLLTLVTAVAFWAQMRQSGTFSVAGRPLDGKDGRYEH
jgi:hypothetical protein